MGDTTARVTTGDIVLAQGTGKIGGGIGAGLEIVVIVIATGGIETETAGDRETENGASAEKDTTTDEVSHFLLLRLLSYYLDFRGFLIDFSFLGYPSKSDRRSRSPARKGTRDRSRTPPSRGPRSDRRYDRKDPHSRSMGTPDSQRAPKDEMDMDIDAEGTEGDDIDNLMRKYMGFSRFRSTKNTQVPGNDIYGVRKEKKTQYRQYMNRTGGFNRPLSP